MDDTLGGSTLVTFDVAAARKTIEPTVAMIATPFMILSRTLGSMANERACAHPNALATTAKSASAALQNVLLSTSEMALLMCSFLLAK